MADMITELRRPATLGAFIFAVIGWLLLIWSFAQSSSDQDALRAQLGDAQKRSSQLADELKKERDAAGSLADIAGRRDAAESAARRAQTVADEAARVRDEAQGQVVGFRDKLKSTTDEQANVERALKDATAQRDKTLGELDTARQQSETLKQAFARASEQLASKNSELAGLNEKLQKAQTALTQQTGEQTEANKRLAQTQDAVKNLMAQQAELEKTIAAAKAEQAEAAKSASQAQAQVADLQHQADQGRQALRQLDDHVAQAKADLAGIDAQLADKQKQLSTPPSVPDQQPASP